MCTEGLLFPSLVGRGEQRTWLHASRAVEQEHCADDQCPKPGAHIKDQQDTRDGLDSFWHSESYLYLCTGGLSDSLHRRPGTSEFGDRSSGRER